LTTAGGQQCSFRQLTDSTWHKWATVNISGTSRSWNSAQNVTPVFCHVFRLRQNFLTDFVYTSYVIIFLNLSHLRATPYLYFENRLKTIENNKSSKQNREKSKQWSVTFPWSHFGTQFQGGELCRIEDTNLRQDNAPRVMQHAPPYYHSSQTKGTVLHKLHYWCQEKQMDCKAF
jgi:hypothetical protein